MMIKKFTKEILNDVVTNAKNAARLRTNLNIHDSADAAVQRLFLAFEPDTYIRPHRHPQKHKWELLILLEGELDALIFNNAGEVIEKIAMSPTATRAIELPANTWHSYISKKSGTLALEIKEGAYLPATVQDFLPMSPAEHSVEATNYLRWMKSVV